jgi:ABC-type Mn2+/Zn2+ transport system ATPase subunit
VDEFLIALRNVTATYEGERMAALHDVTLAVRAGEQVGIVGPNGAGKTTLLEIVNGLLPIVTGTVEVLGEAVSARSHRLRARIAYVPQDLVFVPDTPFLVRDVILAACFGRRGMAHWPDAEDRAATGTAMDALGIADLAGRPVGRLSGGQQRKVLLARALAQRASLLLLDEPTANLDPGSKEEVAGLVGQVRRELRATALVVSHEGGPLLDEADRIVTLVSGRIAADSCTGGR